MEYPQTAERIKAVLEHLGLSAYKFAFTLGYKTESTIYQYIYGKTELTPVRAKRITDAYPEINHLYLIGKEDNLVLDEESRLELKLLNKKGERPESLEITVMKLNNNVIDLKREVQVLAKLVRQLTK